MNNQQTQLQRAKEVAWKQHVKDMEKYAFKDPMKYKQAFDEIVTSTHLQAVNETLETQALALEGMKESVPEISSNHWEPVLIRNQALQQAADHLRAQKITV